jgi:hypothetical protein
MAESGRGSSGEGRPRRRRGWQLPAGSNPQHEGSANPPEVARQGQGPSEISRPRSVLPHSLAGQARNVALGTMQTSGTTSQAVVTLRLEQYDPYAGRTGVVTVRLNGDQAIGFVTDGDWVEVQGKAEHGFINAKAAFNHTSGAEFHEARGCGRAIAIIGTVLVILFILYIVVSVMLG